MPVILNEPLSFIQRTAEYLEYEELLKAAVSANNSVKRLEVTFIYIFWVVRDLNWGRIYSNVSSLPTELYSL